jgi:hypothetical protein
MDNTNECLVKKNNKINNMVGGSNEGYNIPGWGINSQVRKIEDSIISDTREVTGQEAEELLRKYGYGSENTFMSSLETEGKKKNKNSGLTFDEMIEENRKKREKELMRAKRNRGEGPIGFNPGENGYESMTKWETDNELGVTFKIEINSDMRLPRS